MALHIIITAAGRMPRELAGPGQPASKTLLRIGGATLLERALSAAQGVTGRGTIVVVGYPEVQPLLPAGLQRLEPGTTVVDNIYRGFQALGGAGHDYLILSADLPFVTAAAVDEFSVAAQNCCELGVPFISQADFLARFPGAPNKFETIEGQPATMGSAFYFSGPLLQANIPLMQDFARLRKSPFKLAMLLGWEVVWGFITRRITLATLERRASAITGGKVRAVRIHSAELAYDIDSQVEYDFAAAHAGTR